MKAIKTKYIGPTNYLGSRCKASDGDRNSITLSWDDSLNSDEMHEKAAYALCNKMKRKCKLAGGGFKDCMVWVMID
jgi:hypothetical protein